MLTPPSCQVLPNPGRADVNTYGGSMTSPVASPAALPAPTPGNDPFAWLEDVHGADATTWVLARNAEATERLAGGGRLAELTEQIREVLDDDARIPAVTDVGGLLYNFWRDAQSPRGQWRRTTRSAYEAPGVTDIEWDVLLDLDALNTSEDEDWVWAGAQVLRPDATRAFIHLSHGGSDASVTREFDLVSRTFISPDDGGFYRPEAKGSLSWIDLDTAFVFTDFGPGTLTGSGYPRLAKRWTRGTALSEADVVYEGGDDDMYISAHHDRTPGFERDFVSRSIAFYDSELFLLGPADELTLIEIPRSAEALINREWLAVQLRDEWTLEDASYPAGALIAIRFADFLAGARKFEVLFTPTPTTSLSDATWTRNHLILTTLVDVQNTLTVLTPPGASDPSAASGNWERSELLGAPSLGTLEVRAVDSDASDDVWLIATDFLTPTTLHRIAVTGVSPSTDPNATATADVMEPKSTPAFFDASDLEISQRFVTSADGTRVPYFLVHAKDLVPTGTTPTLLYGYGGFEISLTPTYSGALGRAWLARGGAYALANIRGGGEYGPAWHQSALKANRHRAYEDFAAVAQNLIVSGVTAPAHLGIKGGSNGGLLTGNMLVHYPELFGAVVIQVPLLDMHRYPHLLAGASWMAEYGNPDDADEWEFIRTFSPYHLVDSDADYPPVLLTTSTRDDRVHPGHARKMAALLNAWGKDVTYYENIEGGHAGAADSAQAAHMAALAYEFCWERLS